MSRSHPDLSYGVADVQVYAIRGDSASALSSLRAAIDEGWRYEWWYYLKHDLALQPLHAEPEFQAMVRELEAEMAAQRENVRKMEANGELAAIPE